MCFPVEEFYLLSQRRIEQVGQADARTLEPIAHEGNVQFQIRRVHDDHLLILTVRKGFVPRKLNTEFPSGSLSGFQEGPV